MSYKEVLDITPAQKKKVAALKKAYKECIKSGLLPVNIYGSITFYNKKYVAAYGDRHLHSSFPEDMTIPAETTNNCVNIVNEWTDDKHIILLTKEGKALNDQQ